MKCFMIGAGVLAVIVAITGCGSAHPASPILATASAGGNADASSRPMVRPATSAPVPSLIGGGTSVGHATPASPSASASGTALGQLAPASPSVSASLPPPPPPLPTCDQPHLTVGTDEPFGGGSAGHNGYLILFQNDGNASCVLTGYPGIAGASIAGADLYDVPRSPRGMYGGLPPGTDTAPSLVLGYGTVVSAVVEWSDVPSGAATSCPSYPHMLVTVPNTFYTVNVPRPLHGCDIRVHPVVHGLGGGGPDPMA